MGNPISIGIPHGMKIGIPETTMPGKPQPRSIEGMSHLPSSVPSNIPILIGYSSPKTDRKSHGNYYYFAGHVSVQLSGFHEER